MLSSPLYRRLAPAPRTATTFAPESIMLTVGAARRLRISHALIWSLRAPRSILAPAELALWVLWRP